MADGLISVTPTSIAYTGTGATINTNGGVDVIAVSSISLNGVFDSTYTNYMILADLTCSNSTNLYYRFLNAGVDASGNNYSMQYAYASTSSFTASRNDPLNYGRWGSILSTSFPAGQAFFLSAPGIAETKATRNVSVDSGPAMQDFSTIFDAATAYDGIRFYFDSTYTITGNIHVFGLEE